MSRNTISAIKAEKMFRYDIAGQIVLAMSRPLAELFENQERSGLAEGGYIMQKEIKIVHYKMPSKIKCLAIEQSENSIIVVISKHS